MATRIVSKKRKTAFWNPSIKRRKLNPRQWYRNSDHSKNISNKSKNNVNDTDDHDTFEIVKMTTPNALHSKKMNNTVQLSPNPTLTIKKPGYNKHTEYNLQSLKQEPCADINNNNNNIDQQNLNIITNNNKIISSTSEWNKLGELNSKLINHLINNMKFSQPTQIQTACIPYLLSHNDLLIKSETGSGKTLAYLIPIINDLTQELITRQDGTRVMIIGPTRELCIQINNVLQILCKYLPFIVHGTLLGGEDKKKEKSRLRKGLIIVIGTPGRILDHFENTKSFKFDRIKWFVLDEADILLNLGFEQFIRSIIRIINIRSATLDDRCNVLVSATLDNRIKLLADFILNKHKLITLNVNDNNNIYIPLTLKHNYLCIKREYKSSALIGLIRYLYYSNINKLKTFKLIIFMSTCNIINYYYNLFNQCNLFSSSDAESDRIIPSSSSISLFELRGNMTQKDRTSTFFKFCNINNGILLSTDVASRGLDIPSINYIIQYSAPSKIQDYIHRSGRTARMGKIGQTILFLTPNEMKYLKILKKYKFIFKEISIGHIWNQLDIDYAKYKKKLNNKNNKNNNNLSSRNILIDYLKSYVMNNNNLKEKGKSAMQSFVKAYTTYPRELKSIFYVSNLDFYAVSKCFFIEREGRFLRKGGMKNDIKYNKYTKQKDNMRDIAQKMTKKRNIPSTLSEFASM